MSKDRTVSRLAIFLEFAAVLSPFVSQSDTVSRCERIAVAFAILIIVTSSVSSWQERWELQHVHVSIAARIG